MGTKDISKTFTLKDAVTGTLKKIGNGLVNNKKQLRDLQKQGDETWRGIKTGVVGAASAIAGFLGVRSAVSLLNDTAEAAKEQIEVETKLSVIMRQRMSATNDMINGVLSLTDAQEQLGVVNREAQIAGAQELATYLEQADTIKTLVPALNNLIAQQYGVSASSEQVTNIASMMGKVMDGQTGALSRYGFTFTEAEEKIFKFGTEAEKASLFARIVTDSIGNMNEALAQTDVGRIQQAENAVGGLKTILGNTVIFIKGQFARSFMDHLPQIKEGVQSISDSIRSWAENGGIEKVISGFQTVGSAIKYAWDMGVGAYSFFKDNWSTMGPIVYGVTTAFVAYKLSVMAATTWIKLFGKESLFTAMKTKVMGTAALVASGQIGVLTAAKQLLSAAFRASPIGFVITLLGGLVAAGTYVVQNWETVKLAGMNTWNAIVGAVEWGVNAFITYANFMMKIYKFVWDSIEFGGVSIWNAIIGAGESGVNGFLGLVDFMIKSTFDGINWLIRKVNSVSEWLGLGSVIDELTFDSLGKVDFSGVKGDAVAPSWDSDFNIIPNVDFSGAQFGDDAIMAQTKRAQDERDKKKSKSESELAQALDSNTRALNFNASSMDENTKATNANTAILKGNQSATDIADNLLGRIERHLYGT